MLPCFALLSAAFVACGSQAEAASVRVALDWASDALPSSRPARVRIQAHRTVGPADNGLPVEAECGPEGMVLDLGDGVWQIHAVAHGYWSAGSDVAVHHETPTGVDLALWPEAWLYGSVSADGGGPLPPALAIRLSAVPPLDAPRAGPQQSGPSLAELRCPIDAHGAWRCRGPAGLFDARLSAPGFAPLYAWEVSMRPATSADLGRAVLARGASVLGRAVRADGSNPPGPCRATLRPDTVRRGAEVLAAQNAPEDEASLWVPLNRRGYFHVVGVAPGEHVLTVECPAARALEDVSVRAGTETRISPPLLLGELALEVVVSPKLGPDGQPWHLTVDATAPRQQRIVASAEVSADGLWARRGLTEGSYRIALESADGTRWLQRFIELGPGGEPLVLRVGLLEVEGQVFLGAEPLAARLVFFNEAGGEPATLASGDDGHFKGVLPVPPTVAETFWTIEAHATQPRIQRRMEGVSVRRVGGGESAWLDLELPAVAVRGTVVSEQGEPQSGVQVTFEDITSPGQTSVATNDAGAFQVIELPVGSYTATAESVDGASEPMALDVVEGLEAELDMVLIASQRATFHVVSDQGPVADATVQVWMPQGVPRELARTDVEGRVEVTLPPGAAEVGLTIAAPGHALKLIRRPVANEDAIHLDASGGTLVLDLRRPEHAPDDFTTSYLVRGGAIEAIAALPGWGATAADPADGKPVVVELVEPGPYALCVAGPAMADLAALWRRELPRDRCRGGSVEDGQTLTLSLP